MMVLCQLITPEPDLSDLAMIFEPIGINNPLLYHPGKRFVAPSPSSLRAPLRSPVPQEKIVVTSMFDERAAC